MPGNAAAPQGPPSCQLADEVAGYLASKLDRPSVLTPLSRRNHLVLADFGNGFVAKYHNGLIGGQPQSPSSCLRYFETVAAVLDAISGDVPVPASYRVRGRSAFLLSGHVLTTQTLIETTDFARVGHFARLAASLHALHQALRGVSAKVGTLSLYHHIRAAYRSMSIALPWLRRAVVHDCIILDLEAGMGPSRPAVQLVHGDADFRNCLSSGDSLVWCDWENMQLAPVEWDVASAIGSIISTEGVHAAQDFLHAYPGRLDHGLLDRTVKFCVAGFPVLDLAAAYNAGRTIRSEREIVGEVEHCLSAGPGSKALSAPRR